MNYSRNGQQQGRNNQSSTSRKRQNSDNDEDGKQRKCSLCKQTGKYKRYTVDELK